MKKLFVCLVLLSAIIIPLACGNQNNAPSGPIGGGPTSTPTKTSTPGGAATSTPTPTPGGPTNTPTSTITPFPSAPSPTPVFDINEGASSAANGAYYFGTGASGTLYVAENDGINPEVQEFANTAGNLVYSTGTNFVVNIIHGASATIFLVGPQGFASTNIQVAPLPNPPTNFYAILDENASGAATLYSGTNFNSASATVASWGTQILSSPKCLTADAIGNFYVADTGNGYVEEWGANSSPSQYPDHRWFNYYDFQLGKSVSFVSPYSVACDPNTSGATAGNVFVGDRGVLNSKIVEFTSGGAAVVGNGIFYGISFSNCKNN